jgi:RNA polymerase sigma-70 factor (ECF subfamily)
MGLPPGGGLLFNGDTDSHQSNRFSRPDGDDIFSRKRSRFPVIIDRTIPTGGQGVSDPSTFADFLNRVRCGDGQAAEELVRQYESAVRVVIRARLTDPALKRVFDSTDFCQSVFLSFFVRAAAGEFDLHDPAQLVALLSRMARNKLASQVRFQHRQRRDARQVADGGAELLHQMEGSERTPVSYVAAREQLQALYSRLSAEERLLAEKRGEGHTWAEIAAELGGTAQARRKQLTRAIHRVAPAVGLDPFEEDVDD